MKRKAGRLLDIEAEILHIAIDMKNRSGQGFHGFAIAKLLQKANDARRLTSHGTLYKALGRLERAGLLSSIWENPEIAAKEGRPRRRLYEVTELGQTAMALAHQDKALPPAVSRRLATP